MFRFTLFLFLFLAAQRASAQWLQITSGDIPPYDNPAQLIRDHLTGPGIEILDVEFSGVPQAVGYFTEGDLSIGLHRGLLMTTGRAVSLSGANGAEAIGSIFASTANNSTGFDPLLSALTTNSVNDLVRFKITFRASSDSIRFRYVFASEEYPEYACSQFNDIFGFFLEGPGYPLPINIAQVPGTNLPVAINNVHPGNPLLDPCPPFNVQFYHDNNGSNQQPVYDGFLDVFVAEAAVQPCQIYTMTLALADVGDHVYDSGVFLEAKSFGSAEPSIVASFDPGSAILPENAVGDTVSVSFSAVPASLLPLTVTISGTAQNGVDYALLDTVATVTTTDSVLYWLVQPLPDSLDELFETVVITVRDTGCFIRTFTIFIADPDPDFTPVEVVSLAGGPVLLEAPLTNVLAGVTWSFTNDTPVPITPPNAMVLSEINVQDANGDIPIAILTDINMLQSVCFNIQHSWVDDLNVYLIAPSGQFVELTTDNGVNADNYTNTCFSPSATESITGGLPYAPPSAAPFTGTFQPEGVWADLLGATVNGAWRLGVIDDAAGFTGQILDWSLTFSASELGNFQYLWNTGDTTQTLLVSTPGVYQVTISNDVGAIVKTFIVQNGCSVQAQAAAGICPGDSYDFAGETLTEAGIYTHIFPAAASNGCDSVLTLTLSLLPESASSLVVVLQPGESFDFNGQTLTAAGDYQFVLPNAYGCDSTIFLTLTFTSSVGEPAPATTLLFSPNPASDETLIRWDDARIFIRLRVFDGNGRLVFSQNIDAAGAVSLNTSGWSTGWYTVELEGRDGARGWGRLFVKS